MGTDGKPRLAGNFVGLGPHPDRLRKRDDKTTNHETITGPSVNMSLHPPAGIHSHPAQ